MAAEGPAGNREGRAPFPTNAKLKAIFGHAAVITVVEKSSLREEPRRGSRACLDHLTLHLLRPARCSRA